MSRIHGACTRAHRRSQEALDRLAARLMVREERGDVPGWVMITLMTAGLVAIIWAVAEDQFRALFDEAITNVRR